MDRISHRNTERDESRIPHRDGLYRIRSAICVRVACSIQMNTRKHAHRTMYAISSRPHTSPQLTRTISHPIITRRRRATTTTRWHTYGAHVCFCVCVCECIIYEFKRINDDEWGIATRNDERASALPSPGGAQHNRYSSTGFCESSLQSHTMYEQCQYTFSRSSLPANSLRSRSVLLKLDEYLGNVGGGIGRAAIAGFSCDLLTL